MQDRNAAIVLFYAGQLWRLSDEGEETRERRWMIARVRLALFFSSLFKVGEGGGGEGWIS